MRAKPAARPGAMPAALPAALLAALLAWDASAHQTAGSAGPAPAGATGSPYAISAHVGDGEVFEGVRLLGALLLPAVESGGQRLGGLSALAWDADDAVLYALSDRGRLFHLRPVFDGGLLRGVEILAAYPLRDASGKALTLPLNDSEGMDVVNGRNGVPGDARLLIAFERVPRVAAFDPTGVEVERYALAPPLGSIRNYPSGNLALESVALHPVFGALTAPSVPLRGTDAEVVPITQVNGNGAWHFALQPYRHVSLVAMEALPDGSLLTLERALGMIPLNVTVALRRTAVLTDANAGRLLEARPVAVLESSAGFSIDNFEGLARHEGNRFFLVSDDNESAFQKTLLLYFELLDAGTD